MLYYHKPFLQNLFITALFLLPMTQAASGEVPEQVNQMQTELIEANQKIARLASDHQRINGTINTLQTGLNTANHEISDLKSKHNQLVTQRTANGHGRGGR